MGGPLQQNHVILTQALSTFLLNIPSLGNQLPVPRWLLHHRPPQPHRWQKAEQGQDSKKRFDLLLKDGLIWNKQEK